jgi:hypothetical protein
MKFINIESLSDLCRTMYSEELAHTFFQDKHLTIWYYLPTLSFSVNGEV